MGRKQQNSTNKLKLNANYTDLVYSIALCNSTSIPTLPSITLSQDPISLIFYTNSSSIKLQQIANQNTQCTNFTFYTDGSVTNITTDRCSMNFGLIQMHNNSIIKTYFF